MDKTLSLLMRLFRVKYVRRKFVSWLVDYLVNWFREEKKEVSSQKIR